MILLTMPLICASQTHFESVMPSTRLAFGVPGVGVSAVSETCIVSYSIGVYAQADGSVAFEAKAGFRVVSPKNGSVIVYLPYLNGRYDGRIIGYNTPLCVMYSTVSRSGVSAMAGIDIGLKRKAESNVASNISLNISLGIPVWGSRYKKT